MNKDHPYWHVRDIVEGEPNVQTVVLSYYVYRPQSLVDERTAIVLSRVQFLDQAQIDRVIQNCPSGQEVAIHSKVGWKNDEFRHLPMIDMATSARSHLIKLKQFVDDGTFRGFEWFDSGRSFHAYGDRFISYFQWIETMGQLLLSNQKDLKPTVDPRWIGHRLIAGYAALRWTNNTRQYLRTPKHLDLNKNN